MNIIGKSECTASQMAQYLINKNPNAKPWALEYAQIYLDEGITEGVRGDGAWIQSCKETGNFKFNSGTAVTFDQNNFCGMGVTKKGMKGNSFATPILGIRAQIQHLKAYATTTPLVNSCVDPRYKYVKKGCAPTFELLAGKWAVPGYDTNKASSLEDAMNKKIGYGFDIIAGIETMKKIKVTEANVKPTTTTSGGTTNMATILYYRVQLGAYKTKANANNMLAKVKAAGFSAVIKQVGDLYKIQLGSYKTKANANNMLAKVKAAGFSAVVVYDGDTNTTSTTQTTTTTTTSSATSTTTSTKKGGNSSLVNYTKISPNKTSPRTNTIKKIVIHHMAGNLTIERCGDIFANASRKASANYGIGTDGRIGMYVEEKDRSWCSSNPTIDHQAVTMEVANDGGEPNWHVSDAALNSCINLCADICQRNGIEKLIYTGNKNTDNLLMHQYYAATVCPGPYLKSKFPYIADEVNKRLGVTSTSSNTSTSSATSSNVITYTVQSGDTLSKIGSKTGVAWKTIASLNGIKFPYMIKVGQVLKLSNSTISNASSTNSTPAPTSSAYSHKDFVKEVQKAVGAKVDGIAGQETLSKTITVSKVKNNRHAVVKSIQKYLNSIGYDCGEADGIAGSKFDSAVKAFQEANRCVADGEITAKASTWKKLLKLT